MKHNRLKWDISLMATKCSSSLVENLSKVLFDQVRLKRKQFYLLCLERIPL